MVKPRLASWWPVLLMAAALLSGAGFLAWSAWISPDIAYLPAAPPAQWILYPTPGDIHLHYDFAVETVFTRAFELDAAPPSATLHVRALRTCSVFINDHPVALQGSKPAWKHEALADVAGLLHPGENRIVAKVANADGPPVLWLWLECPRGGGGGGGQVVSDTSWDSSCAGGTVCPAVLADDPMSGRNFDPLQEAHSTAKAWSLGWLPVAEFAIVAAGLVALAGLALRRRAADPAGLEKTWRRLLLVCFLLAAALWSALFIHNLLWLDDYDGFDVKGHLNYIQYVQTRHAIPMADQGWEMYQAPLYYLVSAVMLKAAGVAGATHAGVVILRGVHLLLGIVNLAFLMACLRLIFPEHPRRQFAGFILGAFLPMQLYLFQFPTNEVLATTTSTAAAFLLLRTVRAPRRRIWNYVWLGVALGLAMLAKVSGILLALPMIAALIVHAFQSDATIPSGKAQPLQTAPRINLGRPALSIALTLLAALLVAGWYYAMVWHRFGKPIVGNWDPASGLLWWQDPGYRTFAAYWRFGRGLVAPLYASYAGVWDGLYSTLWGDAYCGGNRLLNSVTWSYDLVVVGISLGLLPTLAILTGAAAATAKFIRKPDPAWVYLLGLLFAVILAFVWMTLKVPSYAQPKAFYGLVALVPLCALAGLGFDLLAGSGNRGRGWWRAVVMAGLLTWAGVAWAAYWINPNDPFVHVAIGAKLEAADYSDQAMKELRTALKLDPGNFAARTILIHILRAKNPDDPEITTLFPGDATGLASSGGSGGSGGGGSGASGVSGVSGTSGGDAATLRLSNAEAAARHYQQAYLDYRQGRTDREIDDFELAAKLDPDSPNVLDMYGYAADLNRKAGRLDRAIACVREQIRIAPYVPYFHTQLANLYVLTHQPDLANQQADYAQRAAEALNAFRQALHSQ